MSHSLTSNVKRQINEGINEVENNDINEDIKTHEIDTNRRPEGANRNSIDYERTGLAD